MSTNRLLHFIPDTDLRCSHEGLKLVAKKKKINLDDMRIGDCVIFANRSLNKIKMFASGTKCMVFYSNDGRKIATDTIQFLPAFLSGGELNYRGALKTAIDQHFKRKGKANVES